VNHFVQEVLNMIGNKGIRVGWAGWTIAHPVFGKIEGAAGQWQSAALLLAYPFISSYLRPCISNTIVVVQKTPFSYV
jgi:hypothetical protein